LELINRYTVWNYGQGRWENVGQCFSKIFRHSICMFGLEDLVNFISHFFCKIFDLFKSKTLRNSDHLFANKMMPWADFGAILCWHEEMRRRTFLDRGLHRLRPKIYKNWPQAKINIKFYKFY
jgi:hypothetical protein